MRIHPAKELTHPRRSFIWSAALLLLALLIAAAFDNRMAVRRYSIDAEEISSPVRIALVTDLHSCFYGESQSELVNAVVRESPDLVLLGGDFFDDLAPDNNAELFLSGIAHRYPCYYVTGNHEHWSGADALQTKLDVLKKHGVTILSGDCETVTIRSETLNLCGVDDPAAEGITAFNRQLDTTASAVPEGYYTLLLSHRPEFFDAYVECGFDLVLCGHAHGGQWRIPMLLNGLYAPDQGLFPEYSGGLYRQGGTTMIVSRGLARESTRVPRIFNRPELVIVDLT